MAAAATGEMEETIVGRLTEALSPVHLEVINESHMHSGPAKESHFKVRNKTKQQLCRERSQGRNASTAAPA